MSLHCLLFLIFSVFFLIHCLHYLSLSRQLGYSPHLLLLVVLPHLSSFGSIHNPRPFPSDGAVLVQTWAAQWLVARAGQCGALGGCVSLYPHLWHGLRLSVVSTHLGPPSASEHVMTLMSNRTQNKSQNMGNIKIVPKSWGG